MKAVAVVLCVMSVAGVAACGTGVKKAKASSSVSVVTTTTQLTEWAAVIGGDKVVVHGLLKPNVDPHDYEPTAADLKNIAEADVIVKNGLGLEHWFEKTLNSAGSKGVVVDASRGVAAQNADGAPVSNGVGADPHIWQNPLGARVMVQNVATALEREDAKNADLYAANAAAYEAKLVALDSDVAQQLSAVTNRNVVTDHDAFSYYFSHYGLSLVGTVIPSFDTQAELSAQDVAALVVKIKKLGVKAIFTEGSLPAKTSAAIAAEANVKVVAGGEALYGDSLGAKGSDGATYVGAIRHNTEVFVDNLS